MDLDWDELRAQSLRPGGFGKNRIRIWAQLLHASNTSSSEFNGLDTEPHQDERQIRLDTDRSFVMYPSNDSYVDREPLQLDLHNLLVAIFRKRRKLHYFQGYHDIVTVLFLTLPPGLRLSAAEHLSLHRLRDSMGPSLEPVLALLRILKNLLRLADPQLADILECTSPLPYHALPALLTLLSHDTPTLPLIQRIFDWLLCRPPEAVVWLAASLILFRKAEVLALEQDGEEGMIHSLLSSMPNLCDDDGNSHEELPGSIISGDLNGGGSEIGVLRQQQADDSILMSQGHEETMIGGDGGNEIDGETTGDEGDTTVCDDESTVWGDETLYDTAKGASEVERRSDFISNGESRLTAEHPRSDVQHKLEAAFQNNPTTPDCTGDNSESSSTIPVSADEEPSQRPRSSSPPLSLAPSDAPPPYSPSSRTATPTPRSPNPHLLSLSALLTHASTLLKEYPPTHPDLKLASLLGPASVVHTWCEDSSSSTSHIQDKCSLSEKNPDSQPILTKFRTFRTDDSLEDLVTHPELVVFPYIEEQEQPKLEPSQKVQPRRMPKVHVFLTRNLRIIRISLSKIRFQKRTIMAVLVLGLAIAVYGARSRIQIRLGKGTLSVLFSWFLDEVRMRVWGTEI